MRWRRMLPLWALLLTAADALGQGSAETLAAEPCPQPNAISAIACEVEAALGEAATGAMVIAAPPVSDRPVRDGAALGRRIASVVAGSLGSSATSSTETLSLPAARALARAAGTLLYLETVIEKGSMAVTAEVFSVKQGFWDRIRRPPSGPIAHAFAARRLDAEVGHYLETPPLALTPTSRATWPDGPALALACGDADRDGSLDLVVVTRQRIAVGRIQARRFAARREVRWTALTKVAPVPLREPIGAARVTSRGVIAGVTDRESALELTGELEIGRRLSGQVPMDGAQCLSVDGMALGRRSSCWQKAPDVGGFVGPETPVDAIASSELISTAGTLERVWAWRDPLTRSVELRSEHEPRAARLAEAGAQLALGDLDLDGRPELLTSRSTREATEDVLAVHTWRADGQLELRSETPVPTGIEAIAVCPPEEGRLSAAVVATRGELWVLR